MFARITLSIPLVFGLLTLAPAARAQSGGGFDLSWHALAAGGATHSQGGGFDVSGTAGQPSTALSSGGAFTLRGGFWGFQGSSLVGVDDPGTPHELSFALLPARPNPLAGSTTLEFELASTRATKLAIYDVSGKLVRVLVDQTLAAGRQRVAWDGTNADRLRVSSGVYFARIEAGDFHATSRIVVVH